MNKPNTSLIRVNITPPKATYEHFLEEAENRIAFDQLQDRIWRELLDCSGQLKLETSIDMISLFSVNLASN